MSPISNAQFLGALFHPDDTCWTTHFRENPSDASAACWRGQACRPDHVIDAPDRNAYFSEASFKADSSGRTYANFNTLVVVVLDDAQDCPLDPTWLLHTSADKVQVGYRLSEPVADLGIAKRLHERLAKAGHIPLDRNGNNPVRYVRLPVGVNTKRDPPYACRLEVWQPEKAYSLGELIEGLGLGAAYILHGKGEAAKPSATVGVGMIPEGTRNDTLLKIGGAMRRHGAGQRSIVQALLIENAERCQPPLDESEVTTIGRSVSGYEPAETDDPRPSVFLGPTTARCSALLTAPEAHEFIVAGVIPVCNGVMMAPGGSGKTTVTIYEAICLALGRNVYGRKVLRPGGTLFITGEDGREDYEFRLYQLMLAMKLSVAERKIVTDAVFFEDVSDRIIRLAELNNDGNIVMTPYVDEICRLYEGEGLVMANIDPLGYFSPGERLVNDGESAMCQVAKRIHLALDCHCRLIAHTSKVVARGGITDQYAGRGGAALADNSRQVMQLAVGPNKEWLVPATAAALALPGAEALRMHFHKVSYAVKPKVPMWLMRSGWSFTEFGGSLTDPGAQAADDVEKLRIYIASQLKEGIYHTVWSLKQDYTNVGLTQRGIENAVKAGLADKSLVMAGLPTELVRGARKEHLALGSQTVDFAATKGAAEEDDLND